MGFTRNRVFKLTFDDPEMDGLEVRARSVKLGQILRMMTLADESKRSPEQVEEMIDIFARALLSWNVEEDVIVDGQPTGQKMAVPATRAGLESQDFDFVFELIEAWMDAVMAVAGPLGRSSSAGNPSPEASIPMEVLSPNQPN